MTTDVEFVMTREDAETRLARVQSAVTSAMTDLVELYRGRAWLVLGYESWDELCDDRLGARIALPRPDRREIVQDLRDEGLSQRAIASALGVSQFTVSTDLATDRDLSVDEETGEILPPAPVTITGLDGRQRTYEPPTPHVARNTGDNEWYTPAPFIEAARAVMGGIDLDPASSAIANATVQATRYYSKDDDGLAQPWQGRVWMNPPYAQPLIGQFTERLCEAYSAGHVVEAIVLVNNGTETAWGQQLIAHADAVCFPASRIRFLDPQGNPGAPLQGQMIAYLGDNTHGFAGYFAEFGEVLRGR